ncbi:hypothetical protein ABLB69_18945 [Xenorhabdus khoisanae]
MSDNICFQRWADVPQSCSPFQATGGFLPLQLVTICDGQEVRSG